MFGAFIGLILYLLFRGVATYGSFDSAGSKMGGNNK